MRKTLLLAGLASLLIVSCSGETPDIRIDDAYVSLPVVQGRPAALYFDVAAFNGNSNLTGLSSPKATRIEMHETVSESGIARMRPVSSVPIDHDGATFAPGGKHGMVYELAPDVKAGGTIPVTFHYDAFPIGGSPVKRSVTADVEVRAFGGGHSGH